ncbi:MAG TPA: patatin-like phospholipase family protein [Candidatus Omnitrophota bacterium]|nr:patatin-like phospholipase family protein [Candidatus Omnitrophota bacterium]
MKSIVKGKMMYAWLIASVLFLSSGCATVRHPVPKDLVDKVRVNDMGDIRVVAGAVDSELQRNIVASVKEEAPGDYPAAANGEKIYPVLAISGGAANGAYGAGLLKGWSEEGSRPKFKIVTGVSTGAIIAPFVFLGKEYDDEMEKLYTTMSTKDVMSFKGPIRVLMGDSMASNKPLEKQIQKMINDNFLARIAAEHKKGRRLLVGTTDLDAQRFVIWDMGAIAARGDKKLFSKVILASAAIPVIFPPVYMHVEYNGQKYDEMHVDGGAITQVFGIYQIMEPMMKSLKESGVKVQNVKAKYYIIRNGYVTGIYKEVKDDLVDVANRAFDTIINSQGVGDTYRIYAYMKQVGNDYNLAFIPADCTPPAKEMFDPKQMKVLFDRGYQDAVKGYKWHKVPPGMEN